MNQDLPIAPLRFFQVSKGMLVAELERLPAAALQVGATRAFRVKNPAAGVSSMYHDVLSIPSPKDSLDAGAPRLECDCGLTPACSHCHATWEFLGGPMAPPPVAARAVA